MAPGREEPLPTDCYRCLHLVDGRCEIYGTTPADLPPDYECPSFESLVVDPAAERDEVSLDEVSSPSGQVALLEAEDARKLQSLTERCLELWDQPHMGEELRRRASQGRELATLYLLEPTFGERSPGLPVEVGKVELTVLWASLSELADLDGVAGPPDLRQRLEAVAAHLQQSRNSSDRPLGYGVGGSPETP